MKTTLISKAGLFLFGLILGAGFMARAQLPFQPLHDAPANAQEEQQLNSIFSQARAASADVTGADAGFQRRQIAIELSNELENFAASHTNSAWMPGVRLWLARQAQLRSAYSLAMHHYGEVWAAARGVDNPAARQMAGEAMGGLGMSLAWAGRLSELDALEQEALQRGAHPVGTEWAGALELRAWARKHPTKAYECGLFCLDQLGQLTQPGQYQSDAIMHTPSSVDGLTAADLVQITTRAGLRVRAAWLSSSGELPVPSIVHLSSEHFVALRERRGAFYDVYDPAAAGPRWLTAPEILQEASGCVVVSEAAPPVGAFQLTPLNASEAATYRGRTLANANDRDDSSCPNSGDSGSSEGSENIVCSDCIGGGPTEKEPPAPDIIIGAATFFVSDPWLNLWIVDSPIQYNSAYGPDVSLRLAYNHRHQASVVSGQYWHGAQLGNHGGARGFWACSWMSFAELKNDEITAALLLPQGGWATFTFPAGSSVSDMNYRHNAWLEKLGSAGNYTNLVLHHSDGSGATYGLRNDSFDPSYRVYYRTDAFDPAGKKTTFTYDTNFSSYFGLTNVTAADGTSFTLQLDNQYYPNLPFAVVTNVTSSYGASVSFRYTVPNYADIGLNLTNITDAAGISSYIGYASGLGFAVNQLVTPYGTTGFNVADDTGLFDRSVRITNALAQQEFYGRIADYTRGDWPAFSASQIPTNTPVGALDSSERTKRNTFYWNAQQFAAYVLRLFV